MIECVYQLMVVVLFVRVLTSSFDEMGMYDVVWLRWCFPGFDITQHGDPAVAETPWHPTLLRAY